MTGELKVTFLGVGEAFDEAQANTSLLVQTPATRLLLDCGFSAVGPLWNALPDPEALDAVYLSHTHADHLFGLPPLLVRLAEDGRTKPLTLLGRPGLADHAKRVLDIAYPGFGSRLTYQLRFGLLDHAQRQNSGSAATETGLNDLRLSVAPTLHSVPSMALRLDYQPAEGAAASLCYSGDGMWTPAAAALYAGTDLLIHECYLAEGETRGHASVAAAVELYHKARPKQMALVHLRRSLRPQKEALLNGFAAQGLNITIPEAGETITIPN